MYVCCVNVQPVRLPPQAGASDEQLSGLHIACARSLYALEKSAYKDAAASIVMEVLGRHEDQSDALSLYAQIAFDQGLVKDAVKVALRLLVRKPGDSEAKALLAQCLKVGAVPSPAAHRSPLLRSS